MAVIFDDDFESGDLSAWTGTNGTIAAAGAAAQSGSFGCDANSSDAFAYKDFSAPASQFVSHRADVKLVTASGSGKFRILQISQGSTSIALLIYDNGGYKLQLRNSGNVFLEAAVSGIVANTWQELRIDYDWSPGQEFVATAYVDGVQAAQLVNDDLGGTIWQASRVFVLTFEDVASTTAHAYFDNVSVEDTAPAGGTTYDEAGQATGIAVASGADSLVLTEAGGATAQAVASGADFVVMSEAGGATSGAAAGGADTWIMGDAGGAVGSWAASAGDVMTMVDAGGGVLVAVASGGDGLAVPTVFVAASVTGPGRPGTARGPGRSGSVRGE